MLPLHQIRMCDSSVILPYMQTARQGVLFLAGGLWADDLYPRASRPVPCAQKETRLAICQSWRFWVGRV